MDTADGTQRELILASRSPRRASLLRQAGYAFSTMLAPFDDPADPNEHDSTDPHALARQLASQKARSLRSHIHSRATIIAADTIIYLPAESPAAGHAQLIGQPTHRAQAERMLGQLIGRTHRVVTGVCLLDSVTGRQAGFADYAEVTIGSLPEDVVRDYLDSEDWRGKAGGYNLAQVHENWPIRVTGDPTTVIGLPMRKLTALLAQRGIEPTDHRENQ